MNWEAFTAIGSLLSAVVIAATALIALVQIRHLRAAAQLQGFLVLFSEAVGPTMADAYTYIEKELPSKLEDQAYRQELMQGQFDTKRHKELIVGAFWEKIGTLARFGYLDETLFLDFVAANCQHQWELLKEVTDLRRKFNPRVFERFEQLAQKCQRYMAEGSNVEKVARQHSNR